MFRVACLFAAALVAAAHYSAPVPFQETLTGATQTMFDRRFKHRLEQYYATQGDGLVGSSCFNIVPSVGSFTAADCGYPSRGPDCSGQESSNQYFRILHCHAGNVGQNFGLDIEDPGVSPGKYWVRCGDFGEDCNSVCSNPAYTETTTLGYTCETGTTFSTGTCQVFDHFFKESYEIIRENTGMFEFSLTSNLYAP